MTAAYLLHNFSYLNNDLWTGEISNDEDELMEERNARLDIDLGSIKRDRIADGLM